MQVRLERRKTGHLLSDRRKTGHLLSDRRKTGHLLPERRNTGHLLSDKEDWVHYALEKEDWAPPGATDHVISGPMRGLQINCIGRGQHSTHKVRDIATTRLTRPRGPSQSRSRHVRDR